MTRAGFEPGQVAAQCGERGQVVEQLRARYAELLSVVCRSLLRCQGEYMQGLNRQRTLRKALHKATLDIAALQAALDQYA